MRITKSLSKPGLLGVLVWSLTIPFITSAALAQSQVTAGCG
jgi:hypothetical protein